MKLIFALIALAGIFVTLIVIGAVLLALIRNTRTGGRNRRYSQTDASGAYLPMAGMYGGTGAEATSITHHSSDGGGHGHGHSHSHGHHDSGSGGHSHGGFDGGGHSGGDSGGGCSGGGDGGGGGGGGGGDGGGGSC